jgi:hypothetical protein
MTPDPATGSTPLDLADTYLKDIVLEGRYDTLFKRTTNGGLDSIETQKAGDAIDLVLGWVRSETARRWPDRPPVISWPATTAELTDAIVYYRRQAILRELRAQRPSLFARRPWPFLRGPVTLAPDLTAFTQRSVITTDEIELFAQVMFAAIWACVEEYEFLNTDSQTLGRVAGTLDTLHAMIEDAVDCFHLRAAPPPGVRAVPFILGVRALVQLERGRVARARGPSLRDAEEWLTEALEFYEERATSRGHVPNSAGATTAEPDPKAAATALKYSRCRAAHVLLQLAYLNLLNSRLRRAEAQLKTAQLMAQGTEDSYLQSELKLVGLSIRRTKLSPRAVQTPGSDAARELTDVIDELGKSIDFSTFHDRPEYIRMARWNLAMCKLYQSNWNGDPLASGAMDERKALMDDNNGKSPLTLYWSASAAMLDGIIQLWYARHADEGTSRERRCASAAAKFLEAVDQMTRGHPEINNLRATARIYYTQARLIEGNYDVVEQQLPRLDRHSATYGLTVIPNIKDFIQLLRIEALLGFRDETGRHAHRRRRRDALSVGRGLAELAAMERKRRRKRIETGWVQDYLDELLERTGSLNAFILTDATLREELERMETMTEAEREETRRFTYDKIVRDVGRYLYEVTGRLRYGGPVQVRAPELIDLWKMPPRIAKAIVESAQTPKTSTPPNQAMSPDGE